MADDPAHTHAGEDASDAELEEELDEREADDEDTGREAFEQILMEEGESERGEDLGEHIDGG